MKKSFIPLSLAIVCTLIIINSQMSCSKDNTTQIKKDTIYKCSPNIQGLWEGTYTVGAGQGVPAGTQFYFSFSIYPGGKLSYKSKGYYNGSAEYINFADGTWTLVGTQFNFNVITINFPGGGAQHTQYGSATFNANDFTLSNGTVTDPAGGSATWTMTRVN
ncbi:MAG: hypothetical protein EKK37_03560 [Sphingobacteriales bacterium]|nr:MAG: hypothetical protein EKK37_03560 [Sphingobacteriales bacterium]